MRSMEDSVKETLTKNELSVTYVSRLSTPLPLPIFSYMSEAKTYLLCAANDECVDVHRLTRRKASSIHLSENATCADLKLQSVDRLPAILTLLLQSPSSQSIFCRTICGCAQDPVTKTERFFRFCFGITPVRYSTPKFN